LKRGASELLVEWVNLEKGGITVGNDEKWGLKLVEIENFSDKNLSINAVKQMLKSKYNATFFFGPITTGLLEVVANVTEESQKILISSQSNFPSVWNGKFKYAFGMMQQYPPIYMFRDTYKLYADKGAKKIGVICDSTIFFENITFCNWVEKERLENEVKDHSMTVIKNISVASGKKSTYDELRAAVSTMSGSDIDVLIISCDYGTSYLKDIISFMKAFKVQYLINSFFLNHF
jgi:hypothetical protein